MKYKSSKRKKPPKDGVSWLQIVGTFLAGLAAFLKVSLNRRGQPLRFKLTTIYRGCQMDLVTIFNLIIGIMALCGGVMVVAGTILKRKNNGKRNRKA